MFKLDSFIQYSGYVFTFLFSYIFTFLIISNWLCFEEFLFFIANGMPSLRLPKFLPRFSSLYIPKNQCNLTKISMWKSALGFTYCSSNIHKYSCNLSNLIKKINLLFKILLFENSLSASDTIIRWKQAIDLIKIRNAYSQKKIPNYYIKTIYELKVVFSI